MEKPTDNIKPLFIWHDDMREMVRFVQSVDIVDNVVCISRETLECKFRIVLPEIMCQRIQC